MTRMTTNEDEEDEDDEYDDDEDDEDDDDEDEEDEDEDDGKRLVLSRGPLRRAEATGGLTFARDQ